MRRCSWGVFDDGIVLVEAPQKRGKGSDNPDMIAADEEPNSGDLDKRFQTSSRIPTRQHHSHG